jgi:hypothetical protein
MVCWTNEVIFSSNYLLYLLVLLERWLASLVDPYHRSNISLMPQRHVFGAKPLNHTSVIKYLRNHNRPRTVQKELFTKLRVLLLLIQLSTDRLSFKMTKEFESL